MIIKVFLTTSLPVFIIKFALGFVIFLLNLIAPTVFQEWYKDEKQKLPSNRAKATHYFTDESVHNVSFSRMLVTVLSVYLMISALTFFVNGIIADDDPESIFQIENISKNDEQDDVPEVSVEASTEEIVIESSEEWFTTTLLKMVNQEIPMSELEQYDSETLSYLRNGLYAIHGRVFKREDLTLYFSQYEWYKPTLSSDEFQYSIFNDCEKANIENIKYVESMR